MAGRLLPPSASPLEVRLEQAMAHFEDGREVPIDTLWDPARCPAPLLPWLAWALGVRHWDTAWSVPTQRRVIAASIGLHRIEGTYGAISDALHAIDAIFVVERHTYRYFIVIEIWNTQDITVSLTTLQALIDDVGRLSIEHRIRPLASASGTVTVGLAATAVTVATIGGGA